MLQNTLAKYKTRESGIELLKVIAILIIVMTHSVPYYGGGKNISYIDLHQCTTNLQVFWMAFCRAHFGNSVFVISSAWFLVESKKYKPQKVAGLFADTWFISVCILAAYLIMGQAMPKMTILRQLFPVTFEQNWFITCYIMLYLIHPLLNMAIRSLTRRQHLIVCLCMLCFGVLQLMKLEEDYYYYYTPLFGFIMIYFMTAYVRKYGVGEKIPSKKLLLIAAAAFLVLLLMYIVNDLIGLYIYHSNNLCRFCLFVNPVLIVMFMSLFRVFERMHFHNAFINYLSSISLFVYLIHENYLFRTYTRMGYFDYIYTHFGYSRVLLWAWLFGLCSIIGGFLLAALYKATLHRLASKIADAVFGFGARILKPLVDRLLPEGER